MINLLRRRRRSTDISATDGSGEQAWIHQAPDTTPRSAMPIRRVGSDDTLHSASWPIASDSANYTSDPLAHALAGSISNSSLITTVSTAETAVDLVLGHSRSEFNLLRTLPVVSFIFKKGLFVFPSEESLAMYKSRHVNVTLMRRNGLAMPVLQMTVPMMSAFKKTYPTIVFHKLLPPADDSYEPQKAVYCQVHTKYLKDSGMARFILKFSPNGLQNDPANFQVVMFSASYAPFTDCYFRGTKMRWLGTTPMKSSRGSGFFKLIALDSETDSLVNDLDDNDSNEDPMPSATRPVSPLHTNSNSESPPVTRFSDKSSTTLPSRGLIQIGDIKLIEAFDGSDSMGIHGVADCSLVLTCMSMVLRDQEIKKNNGNARCYDSSLPGILL